MPRFARFAVPAIAAAIVLGSLGLLNAAVLYPGDAAIPLGADLMAFQGLAQVGPLTEGEARMAKSLLGEDVELGLAGNTATGEPGRASGNVAPGEGRAPTAPPLPRVYSYTVAEGDTLWDIAQDYGVDVSTIMGANPDIAPSRLRVGQVVRVLSVDGVLHAVKSGDTVFGLAAKYRIDAAAITKANGLTDVAPLAVGRELILPGARSTIVHTATTAGGKTTVTIAGEYRWPVMGFISSRWGWRWGRFHRGVDIAAPYGRSIVAARAGKVVFAGWKGGYGQTLVISHGDGTTTLYAHASRLIAGYGEWVEAGQTVAKVGSTGFSTGNHCHFEIRVDGAAVDPLSVLP